MAKLVLEIVTGERLVHSDEVDLVVAPGIDGEMAILPNHAPLMTMLKPGELIIRKEGEDSSIFVSGGFFELMNNKITVLADSAERAEEIDIVRAEEARRRAEERMEERAGTNIDAARAEAALRRSLMRLKVAGRRESRRRS
ncbi:MAG: F0F1 ATP synthase subunit epsilon [Dehalococcoidia bacterium]